MARIRIGRLLPGYRDVGIGSRAPVRGISLFAEGESVVIAKRIPSREIAVELICSSIGRELGLRIPEPVLLADADKNWYFGSVDVGHPNLSQVVTASDNAIISKLESWPGLLSAACFDEWIANPDRCDDNLLFDGLGFILIDHGMAIPQGMDASDWSDDYYTNALLDIASDNCGRAENERSKLAVAAQEWCYSVQGFDAAYDESHLPDVIRQEHKQQISKFLRERVAALGDVLYRKLNPVQGALNLND
ncbi:HipA family kinase [Enterobacter sp. R4-368]|uniref:HipA family kinase n=1 Tax=Enterobacter sp. R4-368 TaxID=1166130 RepID=UPI0005C82735